MSIATLIDHAGQGINLALLVGLYYSLRERMARMEIRLTRLILERAAPREVISPPIDFVSERTLRKGESV